MGRSCGVGAWIAGADFGQRLVGLGRNLLSEALVRSLVVVVPAELIAERLQLVDVVGGPAGRGLAVAASMVTSRFMCECRECTSNRRRTITRMASTGSGAASPSTSAS